MASDSERSLSWGPPSAERGQARGLYLWTGQSCRAWGLWTCSPASIVSPGTLDPTGPAGSGSGPVSQLQSGPGPLLHGAGW